MGEGMIASPAIGLPANFWVMNATISVAGATPKVITSASESSCPPKLVVLRVTRAMSPSNMSKNMPSITRPAPTDKNDGSTRSRVACLRVMN
jgi:hypothetical protein